MDLIRDISYQLGLFHEYYKSWHWSNREFGRDIGPLAAARKLGFIICAYCETPRKYRMLLALCSNLRNLYPDAIIVVASHFFIPKEIQDIVDITINDNDNTDKPHGIGEFKSIRQALFLLKDYRVDWVYKFNFDFYIDENNKHIIDGWAKDCHSLGKKMIGASWAMFARPWASLGIAAFYGEVEFLMEYFPRIYTKTEWRQISDGMCEHVAWRAFSDRRVMDKIHIHANYDFLFKGQKRMYEGNPS